MEAISVITGQMAPLPRANVDTDAIIPKQFLKRVERSGFGPFLFYEWSYDEEGELIEDFVLNQPTYRDASVLVSGPNFGSGSSREHAPWSIEDRGFQAVIAPSFADIFYNNCINIGLLPVVLSDAEVATLTQIAEDPDNLVTIDLVAQTVTSVGFEASFDIDAHAKHRLVNGLDSIALTLEHSAAIGTYEDSRAAFKPAL
ncbi:MAG: 3-isopropylmalate dehydratase small subunit [Acidimicrobiia bacterium]|nr:3-isopropylmalate dehydratase small subunit [Acidimicrobiia bacterium]MDX2465768.1 3-isopropylmalate dehydratase small subunit [Acidimicrobiia bacterium]